MSKQNYVVVKTPTWAPVKLPTGTELILLKDANGMHRWFLLLWNEQHAIMSPDPDKWLPGGETLNNAPLDAWFPQLKHVANLVQSVASRESEKHNSTDQIRDLVSGKIPRFSDVKLSWDDTNIQIVPKPPAQEDKK